MPTILKPILTSLTGLSPELTGCYVQGKDGKHYLQVAEDEGWALENVGALRSSLSEEREGRKVAEQKLGKYVGIDDPEAARDALQKVKSGVIKEPKEIEDFKRSLEAKVQKDQEELEKQRAAWRQQMSTTLIEREMLFEFNRIAGGDDKVASRLAKVVGPVVRSGARIEDAGEGKHRAVMHGPDGKQLITRRVGSAEPMSIGEFIESLRTDRDYATVFPGKAAGGSGGNHASGGSAPGGTPADPTQMSGQQLLAHAHAQRSA